MTDDTTLCFVTPSFSRDLERCRLLVESRRACAPGIDHYLVIDKPDLSLFAELADRHTIIVDSRELLDRELHKAWGNNGWWFGHRVLPLRGWITQQLYKLSMPRVSDASVFVNIDSDCVFVRPFEPGRLFNDGMLGLPEVDYRNDEICEWSLEAAALTGVTPPTRPNNYVGNMIPWRAKVVGALTDRIAATTGLPWQIALGRRRTFSEYMLYGIWVRCGAGFLESGHFADPRPLVHTNWDRTLASDDDFERFFSQLPDEALAVMVHSKDGIEPTHYARFARDRWSKS
ncbi:DUF6492 family protein [Tsuneonella amylolytica]|uniref:DUF6492 family protein n=1 Tax=Tsuneonella amylolytica TaxID=2338327 RepID=UPI000EA97CCE|nr:DUF6492 family protein [Tsuneonella amylolytica]